MPEVAKRAKMDKSGKIVTVATTAKMAKRTKMAKNAEIAKNARITVFYVECLSRGVFS